jgi:hypothetical protein
MSGNLLQLFKVAERDANHGGHQEWFASTIGKALALLPADPVVLNGGIPVPVGIHARRIGRDFLWLNCAICRDEMLDESARHDIAVTQEVVFEDARICWRRAATMAKCAL